MLQDYAKFLRETEDTIIQEAAVEVDLSPEEIDQRIEELWESSFDDIDGSRQESEHLLQMSRAIGFDHGIAGALRTICYCDFLRGYTKDIIPRLRYVIGLVENSDDRMTGTAYDICSFVYHYLGMFDSSVEASYKALELFEKDGYERGAAWCYHNLGMVYSEIGNSELSLSNYEKSHEIFTRLQYATGMSRVAERMSSLYRKKGDLEKSIELLNEAYQGIDVENSSEVFLLSMHQNYSITKRLLGAYEDSQHELHKMRRILDATDNLEFEVRWAYESACLLSDTGKYSKALEFLEVALEHAIKKVSKPHEKNIYRLMVDVYQNLNEDHKALNCFKKYETVLNDLMNTESLQKIQGLQSQKELELAEKEKEYHKMIQEETEKILKNVLPVPIVQELKETGQVEPASCESATVLFTDFVGFTALSSRMSPDTIVNQLHTCFTAFDTIMEDCGVEKLKTIGDGYMAVSGMPVKTEDHALRCIRAALKIKEYMISYMQEKEEAGEEFWNIRIGIHSGPLIAGVIGNNKFAYDIWGDTVNTASRIESAGRIGEVNISKDTYELVKHMVNCSYGGKVKAKGKGELDIYTVQSIAAEV